MRTSVRLLPAAAGSHGHPAGVPADCPGGAGREACWRRPDGPGSNIHERLDHPVVHVSWNDAWPIAHGPARACLRRPSGNMRRAAGCRAGFTHGGTNWTRAATPLQHLAGGFPLRPTPMAGPGPPGRHSSRTARGSTTWLATSGSGAPTGSADYHRSGAEGSAAPSQPDEGRCAADPSSATIYCNRYRVAARGSNTPDSTPAMRLSRRRRSLRSGGRSPPGSERQPAAARCPPSDGASRSKEPAV